MKRNRTFLLLSSVFLVGIGTAQAQEDWRRLRPGLVVEVEGEWKSSRGFVAEEIDVRESARAKVEIIAPLEAVGVGELRVLDVKIGVSDGCTIRDASEQTIALAALEAGEWVEIDATLVAGELVAHRLRRLEGTPASIEVEGPVTEAPRRRLVHVATVPIQLSRDTEIRGAEFVDIPRSIDDDDGGGSLLSLSEGRLRFGGRVEAQVEPEQNFDLNPNRPGDYSESTYSADLQVDARPSPAFEVFLKSGVRSTRVLEDDEGGKVGSTDWRVTQFYAILRPPNSRSLALQVGRQDFDESREWLYDENLDAARLYWQRNRNQIEASVSSRWGTTSSQLDKWTNWIGLARREVASRWFASSYVIHRRHQDGDRPTWFGLRSHGRVKSGVRHWVEASWLRGQLDGLEMSAWAYDLGLSWRLHRPTRLTVTAGWAVGSGGVSPESRFQQTGLQDNNAKFGGVTSFRYYGELVDPDLSNLEIATAGVGFRPTRRSSLDLVFHRYRQREAFERLFGSNLESRLEALETDVGTEWDVIVALEEFAEFELEYDFAYFNPGSGFRSSATSARFHKLALKYNF